MFCPSSQLAKKAQNCTQKSSGKDFQKGGVNREIVLCALWIFLGAHWSFVL